MGWTGLENIYSRFIAEGKKHVLVGRNDETAAAIIDYFGERGLEIGRDFRIMGFDDNIRYRDYELTTIAPPHEEIGKNLGELISKYAGVSPDGGTTCYLKVDSRMIKRKSLQQIQSVSYTHLTLPTILLVYISVLAGSLKKKTILL
eukprot:TRINITY_DN11133_c0_g1_i4.p2 TRINITY_DN11133_c0_g1~~TRINITY_DN11133_c0_g1_i4.p2  ORF type:complete len:146 (-),score=38.08 TRINITY_DN11133_c0_g1_i4:68-505(-)